MFDHGGFIINTLITSTISMIYCIFCMGSGFNYVHQANKQFIINNFFSRVSLLTKQEKKKKGFTCAK